MNLKEDTFHFKRFDVIQNQLVHRVGTDGVLLGAWTDLSNAKSILDVGTGTGVIALMLAQRLEGIASITALEPDLGAYEIASRNVGGSGFSESITVINQRVQDFRDHTFDLIVCNPPFFVNSQKPPAESRSKQRHTVDLSFEDLLTAALVLLAPAGKFSIVLPVTEGKTFLALTEHFSFYLSKQCEVFSKTGKVAERYLLELSLLPAHQIEKTSLTIMDENGEWTLEYKSLTRDFYLKF